MKKYFVIIASMLLFFTFAKAQTYPKCNVCNGNKTVYKKSGVKQVCKNCKDWADSYRNIVGCDFCKNKKFIWGPGYEYCKKCNGTGKGAEQRNKEYAEAKKKFEEKEAEYKRSFSYRISNLGKLPDGHGGGSIDLEKLLGEDYFKDSDAKREEIKKKIAEKKDKKNVVSDDELKDLVNLNNNIEKKDENLEGLEDELPSSLNKKDYNSEKVQGEHLPNNLKQKSKVKKDDYYFSVNSHDVNIKSKNNSTSIKDNSGGVNLFDKILTVRDKEVLKIENWKTITFAKSIKDNRGDVIGVKFKNKYAPLGDKSRHYQLMDGEAFELAKRYVQQANERSKYE
jgi:hypothetical protein